MKYLYIDANQYRHLFSRSEGFSEEVFQLLIKLTNNAQIQLLLPQQTKEEVERNRFRKWPESLIKTLESKIKSIQEKSEKIAKEYGEYKAHAQLQKELAFRVAQLQKEQKLIKKNFLSKLSPQNVKLYELFAKAKFIPETVELRVSAEVRHRKGNPPYDNEDIGDCLIWESLLVFLPPRAHLIFIANDKTAWGDGAFDQWLLNEFKEKVHGNLSYSHELADIPGLTKAEQMKIRSHELESTKQSAVSDFVDSPSFTGAGERANRLSHYKDILTEEDFKVIVKACLDNHEIYESFFTEIPLTDLVRGENNYVDPRLESVDGDLWRKFSKKFNISFKRQSDDIPTMANIDSEDIPF